MLSRIPPSETQPSLPLRLKYMYTYVGEKAFKTLVSYMQMLYNPVPPINRSQIKTIGAKSHATLSVPYCCILNRPTKIRTATITTVSEQEKSWERINRQMKNKINLKKKTNIRIYRYSSVDC